MPSEVRQNKIVEKLDRTPECSILRPQNFEPKGEGGPQGPLYTLEVLFYASLSRTFVL